MSYTFLVFYTDVKDPSFKALYYLQGFGFMVLNSLSTLHRLTKVLLLGFYIVFGFYNVLKVSRV